MRLQRVTVTEDSVVVDLTDGRTVSAALAWYPRLMNGTPEERNNWRPIGSGEGVHWPGLDEDLSVDSLISGRPSGERETDVEVTVILQPVSQSDLGRKEELAWSTGFFESVVGGWQGERLTRECAREYDTRVSPSDS